ncbi:N-acetyl-gamma-glutamyl-phosphate reductase [Clostridium pascui]|uniref:N-acetyl-gamma-glutamyl-phosphate reductase n=1 Tax=Clostridium pascui TaxID=46609 RepID=UPI001957ADB1|nr:N-acetyl-gamma-glutamyl-phosphate reductase [Clostridium pascui]MBM7869555.1 N-acetyl-gamma-glutamyl-phosphate reductase [Clostridium pascui]
MINVGIMGATGYAGEQLAWILNNHSKVNIKFLNSHNYADMNYDEIYKNYYGFLDEVCVSTEEAFNRLNLIHVLFIALPHGKSFEITKKALELGVKVIDLGADFRLDSEDVYKNWYGIKHEYSSALKDSVYGLCELNRECIKKTNILANPGCYPTASILALAPLLKHKLIDSKNIIIDAKSGVSGAGRAAKIDSLFAECNESIKAYGIGSHRHTPEIEQELSKVFGEDIMISFTPHLVPMNRGILATCYSNLIDNLSTEELMNIYREFYKDEYFVKIVNESPETRWVRGSNLCHIGIKVDERTNRVIVVSAIDNLVKGAAGQAVQNMNIMFDLKETTGLEFLSMGL